MTIPALTSATPPAPSLPTTGTSTAFGTTGAAAAAPNDTVSAAPGSSTSVTLSMLSAEAGIVATLNSSGTAYPTYDATGLLNLVARAGMAAAGNGAAAPAAAPNDATSTGGIVSGDWGTILKSNPNLTPLAVGYAVTQDIVNTLSTYA